MAASLPPGEVHVWRARLDAVHGEGEVLSAEESRRADALRSSHDRRRFISAHTLLRYVLAEYTGGDPGGLSFELGPHGKPTLPGGGNPRFNLSHAGDTALLAVAADMEVGVDLESVSLLLDPEAVVRTCLSQLEQTLLEGVEADDRTRAILETWVRKEAVAKGRGEGLGLQLDMIETPVGTRAWGEPVRVQIRPRDRWLIWDIPVGRGSAGALAARERDVVVRVLDREPSLPSNARSASLAK